MKTFPMFLKMAGRRVVIAGGGEQAAQKCRLILKTEARITLLAPALDAELVDLVGAGRVDWSKGPIAVRDFQGAALVFVATGCPGTDAALHALAQAAGAVVNVVDQPDLCDAITPSIVDRDPVVVAIGTEGTAPVLARQIKTRVEELLEPRLGELAALAGRLRAAAAQRLKPRQRRDLWRWVFAGPVRDAFAKGAEREAARQIKDAIHQGAFEDAALPAVSLVGAGPGSRDLITLRGVQRLQEADIIFYDRLIDPGLLELARRDAERVYVGKEPGHHRLSQAQINGAIVAAARQGKRVVRLKCGDPGIFARGAEEADALQQAGITPDIVPGVTAASAAAAAAGGFLTERGQTDTLVLSTGHSRDGAVPPDLVARLQPGTTLAIYMGIGAAERITDALDRSGLTDSVDAQIIASAQTQDQKILSGRAGDLAALVRAHDISHPAMILLRRPASAEADLTAVA